jgi:hypothetical protein
MKMTYTKDEQLMLHRVKEKLRPFDPNCSDEELLEGAENLYDFVKACAEMDKIIAKYKVKGFEPEIKAKIQAIKNYNGPMPINIDKLPN